jgi:ABC-type transporter Mla subunit MlaD
VKELEGLLSDLRDTTEDIRATTVAIRNVTSGAGPELQTAMSRVKDVADNLAKATERLDLLIADNRRDLRAFTRDGLPELEALLREGRAAANEVRDLSRSLREDPSQLLYERPENGVEIPQ